jgi:hypothetical protein
MKTFTIIKIGYTAGIYGCSGEYFTAIYSKKGSKEENQYHTNSFHFSGMYGAEERVSAAFKDKGYKEEYTQSHYGQLKRKDINNRCFKSEYQAVEFVKNGFKEVTK